RARLKRVRRNNPTTGSCHLDRRGRSEATEEEWRDPDDVRAPSLTQGILTRMSIPEARFPSPTTECRSKACREVARISAREFAFRRSCVGNSVPLAAWVEHLVSEWLRDAFSGSLHSLSVASLPRSRSR